MMRMKRLYFDYASTTPLDRRVEKVMRPFFAKQFGNPSSICAEGVEAKKTLDNARKDVALLLQAHAEEIVFTSGGTEANNLAIFGTVNALLSSPPVLRRGTRGGSENSKGTTPLNLLTGAVHLSHPKTGAQGLAKHYKSTSCFLTRFARKETKSLQVFASHPSKEGEGEIKLHVVTTNIEHASILEPLRELERLGRVEVTYVSVEPNGIVKPEKVINAIRPETVLVSVMLANNEIGTVQPIRKIAQLLVPICNSKFVIHNSRNERRYPVFHCDSCQAPLHINVQADRLGADLITLDGHKMYGPKGVGALYVRRGTPLAPILFGGGQEKGLRSTTENIAGIVGFAEAFKIAVTECEKETLRLEKLRNLLYSDVLENIRMGGLVVNGSMERAERLPNNLSLSFPGIDTEFLTLQLDAAGISVSTKSSCLKDEKFSYVVRALGGPKERAESTMRFTLGRYSTRKEIDTLVSVLSKLLKK